MIRRVVVKKLVIDVFLRYKKVGSEQFLAMGRYIASLDDLKEYNARQLTARMLPSGDVQVATPFEPVDWPVVQELMPVPVPAVAKSDSGFWAFVGFLLGVIATELVWVLSTHYAAWRAW